MRRGSKVAWKGACKLDHVCGGLLGARRTVAPFLTTYNHVATFVRVINVDEMCPFSVTVQNVPDRELGPLLTQLSQAGFDSPVITSLGPDAMSDSVATLARGRIAELPDDWRLVHERERQSYRWPNGRDSYSPYRVFMCTTRPEGAVQIGLGETIRNNKWGRDRKYVVAFLSGGSPQQPLVEFVAADDYEQTRELVAVIRGSDGGRRMYGAGESLPTLYANQFRTQVYNERVDHPGAWNKIAVVAREDDAQTILNHALIQSRRRQRRT